MTTPEDSALTWEPDWESVAAAQRRKRATTTPGERLRWFEEALTFAAEVGALDRDRRRREMPTSSDTA